MQGAAELVIRGEWAGGATAGSLAGGKSEAHLQHLANVLATFRTNLSLRTHSRGHK